ncbi:MAG: hypothetical protein P4M15_03680 [Alphaproteobacteria bacterium]|nr:hypothetical protein [Alphaproteobacteria bacterium]
MEAVFDIKLRGVLDLLLRHEQLDYRDITRELLSQKRIGPLETGIVPRLLVELEHHQFVEGRNPLSPAFENRLFQITDSGRRATVKRREPVGISGEWDMR